MRWSLVWLVLVKILSLQHKSNTHSACVCVRNETHIKIVLICVSFAVKYCILQRSKNQENKKKTFRFVEAKRINYVIKWHSETTKTLTIHCHHRLTHVCK